MLDASSAIVTLCHRRTQAAQEQSFDIVSQEQGFVTIQIGATSTLARFLATMRLPVEQGNNTHIQKQQNVETHKYAYTATTQMQRYVTRRKSHAAAQKPTTCRKEFRLCSSSQSCVQNFHTQMFKLFQVFKMLKCSKCVQARNHLFFPCSGKFPQSEDFQPCPYFPLGPYVIKRLHSLLPTVRSLLSSESSLVVMFARVALFASASGGCEPFSGNSTLFYCPPSSPTPPSS